MIPKLALACLAAALPIAVVHAEPLPVWEAGPGLALLTFPDYRGAEHTSFQALPIPYLIYRGDRFRVNREGFKATLLESERLDVSLSAAFALPGDGGDDAGSPRAGMPELMPTFEIGPSFDWWLTQNPREDWNWRLRLPVRGVAASDFTELEQAGWVAHPHVQVDRYGRHDRWTFHFSASGGALFANRKYHAYFYEVQPQYATATRPAYEAQAGYSGARLSAYIGVGRGRWRVGLGVLNDFLAGAAFEDSPLVQTDSATVVGLGFTYRLWQSDATVADRPHRD